MKDLLTIQRVLVRAYLEVIVSDVEYEEAIAIVEQMLQEEPVAWKENKTGSVSATIRDERLWTPLYTHPSPQAAPVEIPTEVTEIAQKAIAAMLKEYNYPANTNNAARAGWRACRLHIEAMKGAA
jgi:hypothetical protein